MRIGHGVNVSEDQKYDPSKEARANLNDAGRDRSDTEKGIDDMLFGKGAVRRRPRQAEQEQQPSKLVESPQKQPVINVPKQPAQTASKTPSILSKRRDGDSVIGLESQQSRLESQKKPNSKVVNSVMTGGSLLNEKKSDHYDLNMESKIVEDTGLRYLHNRPAYIRKLKKIAEEVAESCWDNSKNYYTDVAKLYQCFPEKVFSQQKEDFVDKEFPPLNISVGPLYRKDSNITWRRATQINRNTVFGKYVDPNDIQLGEKSSSNFMSILSCLAEREENIKRLIGNQQENADGFYWVRLFINSAWRYYSVDDYLPQLNDQLIGASSYPDQETELSVSLIEKAYAKAYAGYNIFERNATPEQYLKDLTGPIIEKIYPDSSNLESKIDEALQNGWTIVAVPRRSIEQIGLDHNLNLGVVNMGSRGELEIRNSWGTLTERPKINFTKEGIFSMNTNEQSKYIDYFLIAQTNSQQTTSTIQSRHRSNFYSCYTFTLNRSFNGYLQINQWDRRLFPEIAQYRYTAFRVIVEKRFEKKKSEYVTAGCSFGQRNLDLPVELSGGQYAVYCIGSWEQGHNYAYNLCLRGNQRVEFEKSATTRVPNLIKDCLEVVNLKNGKRSAKGHVDEHIMYHKDSNMVLLTLTNVSDKQYKYTQDLTKMKWSTLQVINATRQNEHEEYSGLMKAELADLKHHNNEDRAWRITLQPKESYTWVISTSENYREDNFRNWGFR